MIVRKYVIPALAVVGIVYMTHTVISGSEPVVPAAPIASPATSPFTSAVSGAGVIEASTENIEIGAHRGGVVSGVAVRVGDRVKKGAPLFTIDERAARAELAVREAALSSAQREVDLLRQMPRPENLPPAESRVLEARARLADMSDMFTRAENAERASAATSEEVSRRRYAVEVARQALSEAEGELALLKAGAWSPELAVAQAQADAALAQVEAARTELELLTVRAPIDGEILQLNVRPGEHAPAGDNAEALIVMGATDTLHVRVDIDENDAWRVKPGMRAVAFLRGNASMRAEVSFVRVEPLVVPKRSLTGSSAERVDTRVLQAIYAFPRTALPAYVGQLVDVYIDAGDEETPPAAG